MISYLSLLIFIAGVVLCAIGLVFAVKREHILIEGIAFTTGGLAISGSMLFAQSVHEQALLRSIRSWNFAGLNIMLAVFVTAVVIAFYEVYWKASAEDSNHYIWSHLCGFIAGLSAPLFSAHGLRPAGIGIIMVIAAAIVTRKQGAEAKRLACVLAALGMGLAALDLVGVATNLRGHYVVAGTVTVGLIAIFGALAYLHHKNKNDRYHWLRAPLYGGLAIGLVVLAGGVVWQARITHVVDGGVATAAKFSNGKHGHGDYGNPLDLAAQAIQGAMAAHGKGASGAAR
jgi:hypothetical protein